MEITICENLKQYRKDKGNTQEDLANHLGISIQAVSKWERNEGFPDITLLPKISAYYNVNIDDLLGVGKIREAEKFKEYYEKSDAYQRKADFDSDRLLWAEAFKEFPNNHKVMFRYMITLPDDRADEKIQIAERLLKESPDHRNGLIAHLCNLYARLGNEEKAEEYAHKATLIDNTEAHLLSQIFKGAKLVETVQDNLKTEFVYLMDDEIYSMTWKGDLNNDEKRKARKKSLELYEWLYEDGDYGFYNTRVARIYADFAIFDALDENINGVMTNLSQMADCEINFLTQECVKRTSFLVNRTYQGHTGYSNSTENACRWAINFMYRHWFEFCREDERFKEIEKKLEAYAN